MYAIAAMSRNRVIGLNNTLPWPKSKEDFAFFREKTMDKTVVVGAKTYSGMPPLKRRHPMIVFSQNHKGPSITVDGWLFEPGDGRKPYYSFTATDAPGFRENMNNDSQFNGDHMVCIGGAQTYILCLPYCDSFFVTEWQFETEGDTVMPPFEHLFPGRRKIAEIENGTGIIWEYMSHYKLLKEFGIVVDNASQA